MDLGIKGRTALITGASAGLGEAVAMALAAEGVNVAVCARSAGKLSDLASLIAERYGVTALPVAADLTKPDDIDRMLFETLGKIGKVDILVNNTGGPPASSFADTTDEMWTAAVSSMLMSAVRISRALLPGMKERRWGRIINVTSITVKQPIANLILSNSVRAGVTGFARTLSNEVAQHGITVNNVLPGYTRTQRVQYLAEKTGEARGTSPDEVLSEWEKDIPIGRLAFPHEFASAVAFLASERASYITGVSLPVDGGWIKSLL